MLFDSGKLSALELAQWKVIDGQTGLRFSSAITAANEERGIVLICPCGDPGTVKVCQSRLFLCASGDDDLRKTFDRANTEKLPKVIVDMNRKTILVNMKDPEPESNYSETKQTPIPEKV